MYGNVQRLASGGGGESLNVKIQANSDSCNYLGIRKILAHLIWDDT